MKTKILKKLPLLLFACLLISCTDKNKTITQFQTTDINKIYKSSLIILKKPTTQLIEKKENKKIKLKWTPTKNNFWGDPTPITTFEITITFKKKNNRIHVSWHQKETTSKNKLNAVINKMENPNKLQENYIEKLAEKTKTPYTILKKPKQAKTMLK
mgnify:CR=1 FL=1